MDRKRTLSEITEKEWADLYIFINEKVLGKTEYPHPPGLASYRDEVVASLRHIKDGDAVQLRHTRLAPVLTEEFLPYFVVQWLACRGLYEVN